MNENELLVTNAVLIVALLLSVVLHVLVGFWWQQSRAEVLDRESEKAELESHIRFLCDHILSVSSRLRRSDDPEPVRELADELVRLAAETPERFIDDKEDFSATVHLTIQTQGLEAALLRERKAHEKTARALRRFRKAIDQACVNWNFDPPDDPDEALRTLAQMDTGVGFFFAVEALKEARDAFVRYAANHRQKAAGLLGDQALAAAQKAEENERLAGVMSQSIESAEAVGKALADGAVLRVVKPSESGGPA